MLTPWLLLLLQDGPTYGYEILARLSQLDFPAIPTAGGLYRQLRRLEEAGYVSSEWHAGDAGPDKRYYQLTPAGRNFLSYLADRLARQREALERFLAMYRHESPPTRPSP